MPAHYQVQYDRDPTEFLLPEADDPAYEVFRPVGWGGPTMTLTYLVGLDEHLPANQFVYPTNNSGQFPQRCSPDVPIALSQLLIEPVSRDLDQPGRSQSS